MICYRIEIIFSALFHDFLVYYRLSHDRHSYFVASCGAKLIFAVHILSSDESRNLSRQKPFIALEFRDFLYFLLAYHNNNLLKMFTSV